MENPVYTFQVMPEREQAYNAALLDCNEYRVRAIHTYRGDPDVRTTMEYYTGQRNDTGLQKVWYNDIITTVAFGNIMYPVGTWDSNKPRDQKTTYLVT